MKSIWILLFFICTSCIDNPIPNGGRNAQNNAPGQIGGTRFISADGNEALDRQSANNAISANNGLTNGSGDREAEEGDIYRVLQEGLILNLNAFRGLQIIDFSDPSAPEIIGRVKIIGTPVEMYQVGNFVYILLNNWWGYYGATSAYQPDTYQGGVVISVDISDHQNPKIVSRQRVQGSITTSRLTRGEDKESLYVVARSHYNTGTHVGSFSLSKTTGVIVPKTELTLSGYIQTIQANGKHLLVSRRDADHRKGGSVSIIDISSPTGEMTEGASIPIKGFAEKKSDMNIYNDILRVVSTGNESTNHIETFEVSDISNPVSIDHKTFGDGQTLFATLFIKNTAFFVTYQQQDPFHTFSFSDTGMVTEEAEFIVSGFNNWFRAVNDNKRLIGVGVNDQNGVTNPAVSLYDIEDLKNPTPLLDRKEVPVRDIFGGTSQGGWGEANWDDRAFSVLEKAVSVLGPNGELETGLVLLPFAGWDGQEYKSGVQMFSFSETSITKRGLLDHDTPVRRTFVADRAKDLVANISENELTLHQTADLDAPNRVSSLALSPNYSELFLVGNHLVRRESQNYFWNWNWNYGRSQESMYQDSLQIFDKNTDPETRTVVAEFSIPIQARVVQAGDLFFAIEATKGEREYEVTIHAWDLSNPEAPVKTDAFRTTAIKGIRSDDIDQTIDVVGETLVFSENKPHENITGKRHRRFRYYEDDRDSLCFNSGKFQSCSFKIGQETCWRIERLDGSFTDESCIANFIACDQNESGNVTCEQTPIPENVSAFREREDQESHHSLQRTFHIVDFSDPQNLSVRTAITSSSDEEAVNVITKGNKLHYAFKKRLPWPKDGKGASQYFLRTFDLTNPQSPVQSTDINIPGMPVSINDNIIFTHNHAWKNNRIQSSINRLEIANNLATLTNTKSFERRRVMDVRFSPPNQMLVTHRPVYYHYEFRSPATLSLVNTAEGFDSVSEIEIDVWTKIEQAIAGRAILTVPGGVLIMNLRESQPFAQSFFNLQGWSQNALVVDNNLFIAANIYGIYKFDLDSQNLLQP